MRQITLLLILILSSLIAFGQNRSRWAGKNHYIKIKPKNQDFVGREMYISKVIDKREQKEYLGTVDKNELIYMAQFKKPFEEAVQDIFIKMYPFKESYFPVTVFVHQFLVEELSGKGVTTVDLEFFPTDTIKSFLRVQQALEIEGTEVTKKHDEVIVNLLSNCFKKANTKMNELLVTKQITQQDSFKLSLPVERGIYYDFLDIVLHQAAPNVPVTVVRRVQDKMDRFELKYLDRDRKKIKSAFAVSNGQDLYLNSRYLYSKFKENSGKRNTNIPITTGYYLKAKFYGRYLYFEDRVSNTIATFMFGAIGGLSSMKKVGFVLDTKDGVLHLLEPEFLRAITENRTDIREKYNASKKKLEDKEAIIKVLYESSKM